MDILICKPSKYRYYEQNIIQRKRYQPKTCNRTITEVRLSISFTGRSFDNAGWKNLQCFVGRTVETTIAETEFHSDR